MSRHHNIRSATLTALAALAATSCARPLIAPPIVAEGRLVQFTAADTIGAPPLAENDRFSLPVVLHGVKLQMAADHGASGSLLTDSAMQRAAIPHWYAAATRIDTLVRHNGAEAIHAVTGDVIVVRGDTTIAYSGDFAPIIVDSLRLGALREDEVMIADEAAAPILAPFDGIVGRDLLSAFDLEFNVPARILRLYPRSPFAGNAPVWLPHGVSRSDCVDARLIRHGGMDSTALDESDRRELAGSAALQRAWNMEELQLPVDANGTAINALFDSGSGRSVINWAEAHALGITRQSPAVAPFSEGGLTVFHYVTERSALDSLGTNHSDSTYTVTGISLHIGRQQLPADTVMISDVTFQDFKDFRTKPLMLVGLQAFRENALFMSYSTRKVCVGGRVKRPHT